MEGDYLGTAGGGGRGPRAMPFYLICDVSQPMRGELGALREGIARICQDIGGRPDINDVAHICIMTFADTADVLVQLTQMSEAVVPGFRYARLTHYGTAFRMLATVIANDYETLSHLGYRVYRPCVYFLTAVRAHGPGLAAHIQRNADRGTYERRRGAEGLPDLRAFRLPGRQGGDPAPIGLPTWPFEVVSRAEQHVRGGDQGNVWHHHAIDAEQQLQPGGRSARAQPPRSRRPLDLVRSRVTAAVR